MNDWINKLTLLMLMLILIGFLAMIYLTMEKKWDNEYDIDRQYNTSINDMIMILNRIDRRLRDNGFILN